MFYWTSPNLRQHNFIAHSRAYLFYCLPLLSTHTIITHTVAFAVYHRRRARQFLITILKNCCLNAYTSTLAHESSSFIEFITPNMFHSWHSASRPISMPFFAAQSTFCLNRLYDANVCALSPAKRSLSGQPFIAVDYAMMRKVSSRICDIDSLL